MKRPRSYPLFLVFKNTVTCIFLAVEMKEAELPYFTYWFLAAHALCYVTAQIALTITPINFPV